MGKDSLDIVVTTRKVFVLGPIVPTKPVSDESYSNNISSNACFDRRGSFPGHNERTPGEAKQERLWTVVRAATMGTFNVRQWTLKDNRTFFLRAHLHPKTLPAD